MRSIETEGVVGQLSLDGGSAALGEILDPLVQGQHAVQAVEDLIQRSCPARRVFVIAMDVDEGQACDLSGAFLDSLLDAILGRGDLAFQLHAAVGAGFKVLEPVWGCEVFEQAGDEEARDFAELGHGVQGQRMRKRVSSSWNMGGVSCQLRGRWNLAGGIPHVL